VLIGYQSLNSSSALDHRAESTTDQRFANLTHRNTVNSASATTGAVAMDFVMEFPNGDNTDIVYEGPPALIKTASADAVAKGKHTGADFVENVTAKGVQFKQMAARIPNSKGVGNGGMLDLMVFGEVDITHPDWQSIHKLFGQPLGSPDQRIRTCQTFSVLCRSQSIKLLEEAIGWVAIEVASRIIVFVHVPNSIAKDTRLVKVFYKTIFDKVGPPHLVMGDTNQRTVEVTQECLNASYPSADYATISPGKTIRANDVYNREFEGTNSTGKIMYDVAVYSKKHFLTAPKLEYVSQFGVDKSKKVTRQHPGKYTYVDHEAVALTDHMGMIVYYE
jgi:hypothetical protein